MKSVVKSNRQVKPHRFGVEIAPPLWVKLIAERQNNSYITTTLICASIESSVKNKLPLQLPY